MNADEQRDNERIQDILNNIDPPSNIIVDPEDVVSVWVQNYDGAPKRDTNGKYNWSMLLSQAVAIAEPARPSILLPRAGYQQPQPRKQKVLKNNNTSKELKPLLADNSEYAIHLALSVIYN